jgi:hypothetical protein
VSPPCSCLRIAKARTRSAMKPQQRRIFISVGLSVA